MGFKLLYMKIFVAIFFSMSAATAGLFPPTFPKLLAASESKAAEVKNASGDSQIILELSIKARGNEDEIFLKSSPAWKVNDAGLLNSDLLTLGRLGSATVTANILETPRTVSSKVIQYYLKLNILNHVDGREETGTGVLLAFPDEGCLSVPVSLKVDTLLFNRDPRDHQKLEKEIFHLTQELRLRRSGPRFNCPT